MSFSNRLKEVRRSKGLTQKSLSELIGSSPNSISNYENDVSFPDEKTLRLIFVALQCAPNDLFDIAPAAIQMGARVLDNYSPCAQLTPAAIAVAHAYDAANSGTQSAVCKLLDIDAKIKTPARREA